MKKLVSLILVLLLSVGACLAFASCGTAKIKVNPDKSEYVVGICQLVTHDSLDLATQGFKDALKAELEKEGRTVVFKEQNAQNDTNACVTIVNSFVSDDVDLILGNATPALQAAYNATESIPILGTSITEYGVALEIKDFNGTVGSNVSGTSDLAPLEEQAQMMIDVLELTPGRKVGVLYCSAEANSLYQVTEIANFLQQQGVETEEFAFVDTSDLPAVTTAACAWSDVIYVPTDNIVANNTSIIDSICQGANTPVVAGEEGICTGCGVATLSINYYQLGVITGQMAAKVLLGKEDISTLAIATDSNPTFKFVASRCEKYGVEVPSNYVAIEE